MIKNLPNLQSHDILSKGSITALCCKFIVSRVERCRNTPGITQKNFKTFDLLETSPGYSGQSCRRCGRMPQTWVLAYRLVFALKYKGSFYCSCSGLFLISHNSNVLNSKFLNCLLKDTFRLNQENYYYTKSSFGYTDNIFELLNCIFHRQTIKLIMDISTSVRNLLRHMLVISAFVIYETSFSLGIGSRATFLVFVCFYIVDISYCYLCRYAVLPFVGKDWKSLRVLMIPLVILIYASIVAGTGNLLWLATVEKPLPIFSINQITTHLWRGGYLLLLSLIFYMAYKSVQREREKRILENAFLKAQVNPHLLFNTLNFVYSSIEEASEKGAKAVSLLSDILHSGLQHVNETDKVSIITEIEQVQRYIELSQLVSGNSLQLMFTTDLHDSPYEIYIPSLLLVNFLDNTLKYGELTKVETPAVLRLSASTQEIHFYTKNLKRNKTSSPSHMIGFSNTRKRLDNAYGNKYSITITEDKDWFKLELSIKL